MYRCESEYECIGGVHVRMHVRVYVRVSQTDGGIGTGARARLSETLGPKWLRNLASRAWPCTHWVLGQCFWIRKHLPLSAHVLRLWEC